MANGYSTMAVPGAVGMTRPSMGMTGGTMPNPSTMGMTGGAMPRPLAPFLSNLSLSNSPTIAVNESTPNLDRIQNFPVVSRNGVFHIHQDPATGQRYSMTDEFHSRIPEILSRRPNGSDTQSNLTSIDISNPSITLIESSTPISFSGKSEITNLIDNRNDLSVSQVVSSSNQSINRVGSRTMTSTMMVNNGTMQNNTLIESRTNDNILNVGSNRITSQSPVINTNSNVNTYYSSNTSQVNLTYQSFQQNISTNVPVNTYR